ncbi:HNH endonuclease [Serratia sp. TSA_198.1]|uniref:HNH endonuclease n=1 Tax=Serratia sp. TSA_198.1 TaxID=3415664 RepID=UPI0040462855
MTIKIAMLSSKNAVLDAIKEYNNQGYGIFLKNYKVEKTRKYKIRHNKSLYDINGIATAAYILQLGEPSDKIKFNVNLETVIQEFKKLGFEVVEIPHPLEHLVKDEIYKRKAIHDLYGGQEQGGISTPKEFPVIFIFTGEAGETHGYKDGWSTDDHFSYTGEGQNGNMEFTNGNKHIRDHKENGRDILLFEYKKKAGVKLVGLFECDSWNYTQCIDTEKNMRQGIIFNLFPVSSTQEIDNDITSPEIDQKKETIEQLRAKAITSSMMTGQRQESDNKRSWFKRSEDVKKYVLQRANGICESCDKPAPFKKKNGEPYLEPHHTKRLADEGPDHPQWVGAICPTCHRRIHSGADGMDVNKKLMAKLELKEADFI